MKTCTKCKESKLKIDFGWKCKAENRLSPVCKVCKRKETSDYYMLHKDEHRIRTSKLRIKSIQFIQTLKENIPCTDCNIKYPYYVMDYDHRDSAAKHESINRLLRHMPSIQRVLREIEKCDLVCSNCHRIRTYRQNMLIRDGTLHWK